MSRLTSTTLRVGDTAPPFVLPDLYGGPVSLTSILERRPALLVFAPGSWSPGMRRQLAELDDQSERLRSAGVDRSTRQRIAHVSDHSLARLKVKNGNRPGR